MVPTLVVMKRPSLPLKPSLASLIGFGGVDVPSITLRVRGCGR
jgi:hypothetical protein